MSSTPADRILALFESLIRADSMESAVQGAAHRINDAACAVTTGIVVLIPGGVFLEAWYPEDASRPRDVFQSLRNIAIQAAQNRTSTCMPLSGTAGIPLVAQALHLPLDHRLNGGLCVVSRHQGDAGGPSASVPLDRLAGLLAHRLNELLEIVSERRKSQQFERWFRVSDRQIRALDLERQKFAALVSSFTGGAFLTNREGVISWQSRPLFDRSGLAEDTWVGRNCREFCHTLSNAGQPACGECLVSRVLTTRRPVSCDIAISDPTLGLDAGEVRLSRVVAAPINDLAGHAKEVILTFQEATTQAHKAA